MRLPLTVAAALALSAFACATTPDSGLGTEDDLAANQPFVAIERAPDFSEVERDGAFDAVGVAKSDVVAADGPTSFYLAIHRSQLGERWFLGAYVRQFFPGAVFGGAARTLGTAVVEFKIQNGKLFVIDADDRHDSSDGFQPTVILEAYPIVTGYAPFDELPNADSYVLFDPTAGLNDFGVAGDLLSASGDARFAIDLSFLQRFRAIDDGVTFEHVFTGHADVASFESPLGDSPFRAAGTLGVSLRQYAEGDGYQATPMPARPHFFDGDPRLVPNGGPVEQLAAKWNIDPARPPVEWLISREVLALQADPRFAGYDLVAAIGRGIESWNDAFGFPALTARLAEVGEDVAQDDKNVFIVDRDPSASFAFANWRSNPNTSEIRGASVYFSAAFVEEAHATFAPRVAPTPADARAAVLAANQRRTIPALTWAALPGVPACDMRPGSPALDQPAPAGAVRSVQELVERRIAHIAAHEVGHTLGLRHNFMGSLMPPTSSIMDYVPTATSVEQPGPGAYDVGAIRYLYGLGDQLPAEPFCTDDDRLVDPLCTVFDAGADPLVDWWLPQLDSLRAILVGGSLGEELDDLIADYSLAPLLGFVRAAGDPGQRLRAWQLATAGVAVPLDPAVGGFVADLFMRMALRRLFVGPAGDFDLFVDPPPADDEALMGAIRSQVAAILRNDDGVRSFPSRRVMVDVLKRMQTAGALGELKAARDALTASLAALAGDDRLSTEDLIARIEAALAPYYD